MSDKLIKIDYQSKFNWVFKFKTSVTNILKVPISILISLVNFICMGFWGFVLCAIIKFFVHSLILNNENLCLNFSLNCSICAYLAQKLKNVFKTPKPTIKK